MKEGDNEAFNRVSPQNDPNSGSMKEESGPKKKKSKKEVVDFLFSLVQSKSPDAFQESLRQEAPKLVEQ